MTAPMNAPAAALPVGKIVQASYAALLADPRGFIRIAGPWWLAIALIALLRVTLAALGQEDVSALAFFDIAGAVVAFIGAAVFAVHWNRAVLLREGLGEDVGARRAMRFAGLFAVLAVIVAFIGGAMVIAAATVTILIWGSGALDGVPDVVGGWILAAGMLIVGARLLPALALVAIDFPGPAIKTAYRMTRGHGLALFHGAVAVVLPALVLRSLPMFLAKAAGDHAASVTLNLLTTAMTFAIVALGTSFGACAYIALRGAARAEDA